MTWLVTSLPFTLSFSNYSWPTHVCDDQVTNKARFGFSKGLAFPRTHLWTLPIMFPVFLLGFFSRLHSRVLKTWLPCKTVGCEHSHNRQTHIPFIMKSTICWLPLIYDKDKFFSLVVFSSPSLNFILVGLLWQIWWTKSGKKTVMCQKKK